MVVWCSRELASPCLQGAIPSRPERCPLAPTGRSVTNTMRADIMGRTTAMGGRTERFE